MGSTLPQRTFIVAFIVVSLLTACAGPAMRNRGISHLNAGQFDKAISDFTIAIQHQPNGAALWNFRGVAYYRKAQFNNAVSDFGRAIELEPNNPLFRTNRADAYNEMGRLELALSDLEQALKLNPNNKTARDLLTSIKAVRPQSGIQIPYSSPDKGGWLGVYVQSITPELAKSFLLAEEKGALVARVDKGSPAFKAGLMAEDVILEFNRKPVSGSKELVALVRENAPGSNTLLKVWRNGAPLYMSAILGPRPPDAKGTPAPLPPPPPTKGKPKETPEELKSKEMAKQEQKTASAPSLVVHGISIKPSPVPAGQKFTVEVEFTVTDPAVKAEKVPVQFRFAILSGPKVIKKEKPISVNAYNGSTTQQIKPMSTKTTTKGAYTIQVSLKYKDMVKKDSVDLTIQ